MPAIYRVPQGGARRGRAGVHHIPIFILVETKQESKQGLMDLTEAEAFTVKTFDESDAEDPFSVSVRQELITPDDVRGTYDTLNEAVLAGNWPTLKSARGKVIFLMDQRPVGPVYLARASVAARTRAVYQRRARRARRRFH